MRKGITFLNLMIIHIVVVILFTLGFIYLLKKGSEEIVKQGGIKSILKPLWEGNSQKE